MKWRAFSRMPQWVRLSEWLGRIRELEHQAYKKERKGTKSGEVPNT